jgi:hypothetical protein
MPNLTASIPHQLTRAEAKGRIQDQVGTLRQQKGVPISNLQETWTGDRMDFSVNAMGQAISGHLTVDDHMVHLDVALPWLLNMLAGAVKHRIEQQGRHVLTQLLLENRQVTPISPPRSSWTEIGTARGMPRLPRLHQINLDVVGHARCQGEEHSAVLDPPCR